MYIINTKLWNIMKLVTVETTAVRLYSLKWQILIYYIRRKCVHLFCLAFLLRETIYIFNKLVIQFGFDING